MARTPAISFDEERIPTDIEVMSPRELRSYEDRLFSLGTKLEPYRCGSVSARFHPDGIFAEVAPEGTFVDMSQLLLTREQQVRYLQRMIGVSMSGRDYINLNSIRAFNEKCVPRMVQESRVFGCSPDYYNGRRRLIPTSVMSGPYREGSFHIHMDLAPAFCDKRSAKDLLNPASVPTNVADCAKIANEFYEATSFLHDTYPKDVRLWYRKPRVYRPKPYGIEYRAIGSGITQTPARMEMLIEIAFMFMKDHFATHSKRRFV